MARRSLDAMLRGMDPAIAGLLTSQPQPRHAADNALDAAVYGRTDQPRLSPEEAERRVRASMADEIDDLQVSFQVCYVRDTGMAGILMVTCQPRPLRNPGPITLEVHEREQRIAAEMPAFMERFRMSLQTLRDSAVAHDGVLAFREALARGSAWR